MKSKIHEHQTNYLTVSKKTILLFAVALAFMSCKDEDQAADHGAHAMMTFTEKQHDFGTINQGDIVEHDFVFKNTGGSNLIISNAVGSCGCTVPEYPKDPIAPGETETMKVKFNSAGKSGMQTKTVTITANTMAGKEILTIKASINAG